MAGVHEGLEGVGAAVGAFDGIGIDGIVAPTVVAGEFRHRHQLDCVEAQRGHVVEARAGLGECAHLVGGGAGMVERANVQFVEHQFFRGGGQVLARAPFVGAWIVDDSRGIAGMNHPPRPRIAAHQGLVDGKSILVARPRRRDVGRPDAVVRRHFKDQRRAVAVPAVEGAEDRNLRGGGGPDTERHAGSRGIGIRHRAPARACGLGPRQGPGPTRQ